MFLSACSAWQLKPTVCTHTHASFLRLRPSLPPAPRACTALPMDSAAAANPDVASALHRHQEAEIDRLISDHMERLRAEVWRGRDGLLRRLAAAAGVRLRAKDDEVKQVRRLNAALEERVRALSAENGVWRDMAQSHEAAAQALRSELEAALLRRRCEGGDEESCCGGGGGRGRACRACGKAEATVLLLPCRHLCLCSLCASGANHCPLCSSSKQCTIHVNFP